MKLATDWTRKQGQVIAYVWVRENDTGDGSKGRHVHILCHYPDTIPIGRMWQLWLRKVAGRPYRAKAIKSERIGGTLNAYATSPAAYLQNLDRLLAYLVKGVSHADAETLGLPKQEVGGWIIGKRAEWSQNIGTKSRVQSECVALVKKTRETRAQGRTCKSLKPPIIPFVRQTIPTSSTCSITTFKDIWAFPPMA